MKKFLLSSVAALAIVVGGAAIQAPQPAQAGTLIDAIVTGTKQVNTINNQSVSQSVASVSGSGQYLDVTSTTAGLGNAAIASTDVVLGDCSCFDNAYAGIGQLAEQTNNMVGQSVASTVTSTSTGGATVAASTMAVGNIVSNTASLSSAGL